MLIDEFARIGVLRMLKDFFGQTALNGKAAMYDDELVRNEREHAEIMRDEDHRSTAGRFNAQKLLHDGVLTDGIDGRCRLVADDEGRLQSKRETDHHALEHAARHLMRIFAQHILRVTDLHEFKHFDRFGPNFGAAPVRMFLKGFCHLSADAVERIKAAHGVLEHHADP